MPLDIEVGLGPGDLIVFDEDPAAPRKMAQAPHPIFGPYVYCGQTARWIKMPFGMGVGLSPSDAVLDWDPAPPKRGTGH